MPGSEGGCVTDLQRMYGEQRDQGRGHVAAISRLARRLNVDPGTVKRVLRRADLEYRLARRRQAREA